MNGNKLKIGCIVMAAGRSSRFGANKLLLKYEGKSLASRALEVVPADKLSQVVVVTGYTEVQELAELKGFKVVRNSLPEKGISLTIRLGLENLQKADAAMFMVCDQPLLNRASVSAALDYYREHQDKIVSLAYNGVRGNPCIFPSWLFPELSALEGDTGGGAVISKHKESLLLFEAADASELRDVDHTSDLY